MLRNYWLDVFTGKTWEEFLRNGANVAGFRLPRRNYAKRIRPGDHLLCYISGISRMIGIVEVLSKMYIDETPIWSDSVFPVRFKVKLIYKLMPEAAVPIETLKDELTIFKHLSTPNGWTAYFRGSPSQFNDADGKKMLLAVKSAFEKPIKRKYDKEQYKKSTKQYDSKKDSYTLPTEETVPKKKTVKTPQKSSNISHEEMQILLINLGAKLGLKVWVPLEDRNKSFKGKALSSVLNMLDELPINFDEVTNRAIELIDVLWLKDDSIVAAFEVENTPVIYSGLLRMSDLISMQPNIDINLFIVAPGESYDSVLYEINRPTFSKLKIPLKRACRFISYSKLQDEIKSLGKKISMIKYEGFLDFIADSCEMDD